MISLKRSTASGTASPRRNRYKIRTALSIALIAVALVSIASAFLAAHLFAQSSIQHYFNQCRYRGGYHVAGPSAQGAMKSVNEGFLIASVIAIGLGLLVSLLLARKLSCPLVDLTGAVKHTIGGDYSHSTEVTGSIEVEDLGEAFNSLIQDLKDKEENRRNMVTDIAHELRNPLATIKAQLESVKDGVVSPDEALIESISEDVNLLSRLVDDLRELALVESGQLRLERIPLDVKELMEGLVVRYSADLEAGGIRIVIDVETGLPEIQADEMRMTQILSNLLKNSIYHSREGGLITLGARRKEDFLEIRVADTGVGIAPEDLPFIFDRFYRRELLRGNEGGSAGIGLTVSRSLVEAHGGSIRAESEPGKGTTIYFTVPISA